MSSKCEVTFENNPDGVYYAGQTVAGEIKLTTAKPKTIRAIHITVIGFAEVRFTDDKDSDRHDATDKHKDLLGADEQYLFIRKYLQGERNGTSFSLPAGTYIYKFEADLPKTCPTSFNGEFGQIRYEVVLTIDRAWKYDNIFKEPFTVIHDIDLNSNLVYKAPTMMSDFRRLMGIFCLRTPLLLTVNCPFTGYAPGQMLIVHIQVQNFTFSHCTAVKVKLQRMVKYTSTYPEVETKEVHSTVREGIYGSVPKFRRKHILATIPVLSVPPSTLGTCKCIDISYRLKVKVVVAGWHKGLKVKVPITVGTVPLRDTPSGDNVDAAVPVGDAAKTYKALECFFPQFDNSYDESSSIKNANYLPKYPYYEQKTITLPLLNRTRRR